MMNFAFGRCGRHARVYKKGDDGKLDLAPPVNG